MDQGPNSHDVLRVMHWFMHFTGTEKSGHLEIGDYMFTTSWDTVEKSRLNTMMYKYRVYAIITEKSNNAPDPKYILSTADWVEQNYPISPIYALALEAKD